MIRSAPVVTLTALAAALTAAAQNDLKFEVASVRSSPPASVRFPKTSGGPGTGDPAHLRYTNLTMLDILGQAFLMQADQFTGPDWALNLDAEERFDISANVPRGTTKQQATIMLQNLLKERFHLAFHRAQKTFDVYELAVAKDGPQLKTAEIPAQPPISDGPPHPKGADGFPDLPPGWPYVQGVSENGSGSSSLINVGLDGFRVLRPWMSARRDTSMWRYTMRMITMEQFVNELQNLTGFGRITDHTGLSGQYDIKLAMLGGGGDVFSGLEKQLGLELRKAKTSLDVIVIDRLDRQPVAN